MQDTPRSPAASATARADQTALVWFRRDLRLHDNPAWASATQAAASITALYVLDDALLATAAPYRRNQLLAEVETLDRHIEQVTGGRLYVLRGDATELVPIFAAQFDSVHWNSDVTPYATRRDASIEAKLGSSPTAVHTNWGTLHYPTGSVLAGK